jgi:hypothetical protein
MVKFSLAKYRSRVKSLGQDRLMKRLRRAAKTDSELQSIFEDSISNPNELLLIVSKEIRDDI